MQALRFDREVFQAILSATYSPRDLHDFVQLCYSLALPTIRRRIATGKLNCHIIRLKEADIVQDCIADLFERDESRRFPQIVRFFAQQIDDLDAASDERLLMTLRRLVLGKVNNSIVRLYTELDPTLGRIIRNITVFVDRTDLFAKHTRFGEACLITTLEPLCGRPPIPLDLLRDTFMKIASVRDTVPALLQKLHKVLLRQKDYQRVVVLVGVAVMFKEVYSRGREEEQVPDDSEANDVELIIESVCKQLEERMHRSYVQTGKKPVHVLQCYMTAVREMLVAVIVDRDNSISYFGFLSRQIPNLTKAEYLRNHRVVFEHISKTAKREVANELRSQ